MLRLCYPAATEGAGRDQVERRRRPGQEVLTLRAQPLVVPFLGRDPAPQPARPPAPPSDFPDPPCPSMASTSTPGTPSRHRAAALITPVAAAGQGSPLP